MQMKILHYIFNEKKNINIFERFSFNFMILCLVNYFVKPYVVHVLIKRILIILKIL